MDAEFTYPVSRLAVFTSLLLLIGRTTAERVVRIRHQFPCFVMVLFATLAFTPTSSLLFTGAWICKNTKRYDWTIEQFVSNQLIIEHQVPNSLLKKVMDYFYDMNFNSYFRTH